MKKAMELLLGLFPIIFINYFFFHFLDAFGNFHTD